MAEAREIAIMSSGDEMSEGHAATKFAIPGLEARYEAARAQGAVTFQSGTIDISIRDDRGVIKTNPTKAPGTQTPKRYESVEKTSAAKRSSRLFPKLSDSQMAGRSIHRPNVGVIALAGLS